MTIIDHVARWASTIGGKTAVIAGKQIITYSELYPMMVCRHPLPIPLLGESWDGDFCLYTTGTTGQSKGVVISQEAVIANSENLIEAHGYHRDIVFIITGDMEHLGCWSKIFPVFITGGTLVILQDGMKSLDKFFSVLDMPLQEYGLSANSRFASFLVPTNIKFIMRWGRQKLSEASSHIEFIETGGAPMAQTDMEELCQLLPTTRLFNTYASTETGIVCTHNYNQPGWCKAGLLGRPMRHSEIFITPEGKIACKGPTLMIGYKNAPELTATILHDGVLCTADNGFIDENGMLHMLGRDGDVINVGGYKVAPDEVEDAALSHPSVNDCICIAQPHKLLGFSLLLLVQLNEGFSLDVHLLARHIASRIERYKVPLQYKVVNHIERNQNGKLDRKHYRL